MQLELKEITTATAISCRVRRQNMNYLFITSVQMNYIPDRDNVPILNYLMKFEIGIVSSQVGLAFAVVALCLNNRHCPYHTA